MRKFTGSVLLFHWDETANVSAANGTRLLRLDKTLAAVRANAEVPTGHYKSVFWVGEADQALLLAVVFFDVDVLLCFDRVGILSHSVDRLYFEGQPVY